MLLARRRDMNRIFFHTHSARSWRDKDVCVDDIVVCAGSLTWTGSLSAYDKRNHPQVHEQPVSNQKWVKLARWTLMDLEVDSHSIDLTCLVVWCQQVVWSIRTYTKSTTEELPLPEKDGLLKGCSTAIDVDLEGRRWDLLVLTLGTDTRSLVGHENLGI